MKFFTPELYLRYNSGDDAEADRADEDWEAAIRDYRRHLGSIREELPPRARELAEVLCLHDAELFALRCDPPRPAHEPEGMPYPVATILLRQGDLFVSIDYLLWGPAIEIPGPGGWPKASSPVCWLYDEVDSVADEILRARGDGRPLWHRILFSDGRSLAIPFLDVIVNRFSAERAETTLVERAGIR